jgi:hypothetical protein
MFFMPATMVMLLTEMLNKVVDEVRCSHLITINKEQEQDIIAVSSYEETTFLSCSPMHCDSRGQEHNVCKELLA